MSFRTIEVYGQSQKQNHLTSESGKLHLKKFKFEFYEEQTKIIRYIHYLKTSIDFHKVIIFVKKYNFIFIWYYFVKEEHNFKTDLSHWNSETNSWSYKRS